MRRALVLVCLLLAGCGSSAASSGPRVVATTTQLADIARNVAPNADVQAILAPNTDPHEYEVRPRDVKALAHADVVLRSGGEVDAWLDSALEAAGVDPAGVVDAGAVAGLVGDDPHWWQDPRRVELAAAAVGRAIPGANAAPYVRPVATPRRRGRALPRRGAGQSAQARHEPRRVRLLRPPLRDRRRRHRDPVAVHLGRAVRGRRRQAADHDPDDRRPRDLQRERRQPQGRERDRPRNRRPRRPRAVGRFPRPEGQRRRDLHQTRSRPTPAPSWRASRADPRRAPSMPDLAAPYIQRGIVEVLLLAVLAGVLGTWVVLRRLPFFAHAVGTATFPGLVVAGPWGVPAQLTALVCAVGFGGALERLQRTRRIDPDAATGLLLVAALAIGVVLASDVYHSGASVDRLLFGSLIALTPLDLWLTAAAAVGALLCDRGLRRSWLATGLRSRRRPRGRRPHGVRGPRAADRRGDRGGRLARRGRRAARDRRPDRPRRNRPAVRTRAAARNSSRPWRSPRSKG